MQRLETNLDSFGAAAPGSLQLITPLKSARKELPDPIELHVERWKASPVIRTGCIPCLNAGLKCTPLCHADAVCDSWRINIDALSPQQQGTWRERHGLHLFIDLALSPVRLGMCTSPFWQQTVMQLVLTNAAVFHVASAIGALRSHLIRVESGQEDDRSTALSFGLRQCNRSIALLTQAARDGNAAYNDPGIALIVCILFTIFEALYGDPGEALTHVLQGRKILWKCEQDAPGFGGSSVIPITVRPVLGALQLQAACLSGSPNDLSSPLDPLPLPEITQIRSLDHANRILHVIYSNLLLYHQHLSAYCAGASPSLSATQKKLRFEPWLKAWEREFADYLFTASSTLTHEDMQKAKVLKANHLLSVILAQVDTTAGWQAWEPFTAEFKAIIDLAAAVLNAETSSPPSSNSITGRPTDASNFPSISSGLWIAEPLFVCVSRCTNEEWKRQAAGLLNGISKGRASSLVKRRSMSGSVSRSRSGTVSRTSSSENANERLGEGTMSGSAISRPPS